MSKSLVICLAMILLAGAAYAIEDRQSDPNSPESILRQIRQLQTEAEAVAQACGGEAAVEAIAVQIRDLAERLPRNERGERSLDQGGENCNTATVISAVPYCDVGSTQGHTNDYNPDPSCSPNSTAPDVVYSYTPTVTSLVTISLCGSSYNTVLHVYQGCPDQGIPPMCCNDDAPGCGLASCCRLLQLVAGNTYYIVVDGAGNAAGNYVLHLSNDGVCGSDSCGACVVSCPPGAIIENEACPASSPDTVNGGHCGQFYSDPISCNSLICGRAAADANVWDQDNYLITITQPESLRWCVYAEFPVSISVSQYISYG